MSSCQSSNASSAFPSRQPSAGISLLIPILPSGTGGFWVAESNGEVVGTVGLKDIGLGQTALRKMFVAAPFRGRELGVAGKLLDVLLAHARAKGVAEIFLGTTDKFLAAHRFYEKRNFRELPKAELPEAFPVMAVDSKFYVLSVS